MQSSPADDQDHFAPEAAEAVETAHTADGAGRAELAALEHQALSGARWFYWIAALSLVNSAILHGGAETQFVIGLGTMQAIDGIAQGLAQQFPDNSMIIRGIAIALDVGLAGFVALFGWLCGRRYAAAFVIGMGLYLLDGLIFLLVQDWYSAGFHAFALYCMGTGLSATRRLNALEAGSRWSEEAELAPAAE